MQLATLPTDRRPARPVAPVPLVENIPAELKARAQWVLWRYEWKVNKQGIGKWTKVPYGTREVKAATNRPTSWQSFASALERYRANRDYFDGIGYVFAKDDPYVGGDRDHDLSTDGLPATYTETSPSGNGNKFIARASGDYGRKTKSGELYSSGRFFTITGRVLPGREVITDCQAEVEAFYKSLGGRERKSGGGGASANGSRAELVKAIPESDWDAARALLRDADMMDRLDRRVRAAGGEGTQFALLLRGDYREFDRRWSFVGLFRADGSLDDSQVRAVAARGLRGRGFTFAEYAAWMHRHYAAAALAKWGSKELWRQELAALWEKSPAPRYARQATPAPAKRQSKVKRGRAGNHHVLVEHVYGLLLEHRAGAEAIVTAREIAGVIYCARETVARIIAELVAAGRIATRRLPRHGGMVITFLDVIYSPAAEGTSPQPIAPNDAAPTAALEETENNPCVSSESREADHSSPTLTVILITVISIAAYYLDQRPADIGQQCVSKRTGQVTYRRTAKHFAGLVVAEYPYTFDQAAGLGKRHGGRGGLDAPNEAAIWTFYRSPSLGCIVHQDAECTLDIDIRDLNPESVEASERAPGGQPSTLDEWEWQADCHGAEELNALDQALSAVVAEIATVAAQPADRMALVADLEAKTPDELRAWMDGFRKPVMSTPNFSVDEPDAPGASYDPNCRNLRQLPDPRAVPSWLRTVGDIGPMVRFTDLQLQKIEPTDVSGNLQLQEIGIDPDPEIRCPPADPEKARRYYAIKAKAKKAASPGQRIALERIAAGMEEWRPAGDAPVLTSPPVSALFVTQLVTTQPMFAAQKGT